MGGGIINQKINFVNTSCELMCFVTLEVTTKKFCLKRSNICSRFEAYSDLGNRTLAFRLLVTTRCQVLGIDHWVTGQLTGHRQVKIGSVVPTTHLRYAGLVFSGQQ